MTVNRILHCPSCGAEVTEYANPVSTVDAIIEVTHPAVGIVLIYRKNEPHVWALPGGFVDYGESLEDAVIREAQEETGLLIRDPVQFHTYSQPDRDPRRHTVSTVFLAQGEGQMQALDDAADIGVFTQASLPKAIAFDHAAIIQDYFNRRYP